MLQQKIMDYLATQTGNVAVVYKDLTSGEGFSICGDERFPSASIIKPHFWMRSRPETAPCPTRSFSRPRCSPAATVS